MSLLSLTSPTPSSHSVAWRRRRRRRWTRCDDRFSPAAMFSAIPSLPRAKLMRLTHRMVESANEFAGDADTELEREQAYE